MAMPYLFVNQCEHSEEDLQKSSETLVPRSGWASTLMLATKQKMRKARALTSSTMPKAQGQETRSWACTPVANWLLQAELGKGRFTLPSQAAGHRWMKYLILFPLWQILCLCAFAVLMLPRMTAVVPWLAGHAVAYVTESRLLLGWFLAAAAAGIAYDVGKDVVVFALLRRGLERADLPEDRPRLVHAVVICEYKEPYEVLAETVRTLKAQTLAHNTIVVIAQEERDPEADETFERLCELAGSSFRGFICTRHTLQPGEVAGKSSNENHAVRQLYHLVQEEGLDPYQVMVTTADADSSFHHVFLEQLESEFCRLPDGRHVLFDSPTNTYRNLSSCDLIVQHFEVARTQFCTFTHLDWQPCQSNYSLTLGFAHAINFWDGDNTSEDFHTTMKALAHTNAKTNMVVPVWSLILNDSVTSFGDRWTQAKRHMWGIEEVAWILSLFPVLRFRVWMKMLSLAAGTLLTDSVVPRWLIWFFPQWWAFLAAMDSTTLIALALWTYVLPSIYRWSKVFVREFVMRHFILSYRGEEIQPMGWKQWAALAITFPVLEPIGAFVFNTCATWRMLAHATKSCHLKYITAPKQFEKPKVACQCVMEV